MPQLRIPALAEKAPPPSLKVASAPDQGDAAASEVLRGARRRGSRWSLLWALVIHGVILILGALYHVSPELIAQIGNAVTLSTDPAVDRQQESTEDEMVEEVVLQSSEAPPPKPREAAIPELIPITRPVDVPLPPPVEALDTLEMEPEVVDLGEAFGEGAEGLDPEEQVLETKMFSAPAKGDCTIFVIDVSTSMPNEMGWDGIRAMRRDLKMAIEALPPRILFNLICFGDKADGFAERPIFATAEHKALAHRFMEDYFTGKFTRTRTGRYGRSGLADEVAYIPIEPSEITYLKKTRGGSRYDLALIAAFQQRASTVYLVTDGTPSVVRDRGFLPGSVSVSKDDVIRTVLKAGRRRGAHWR